MSAEPRTRPAQNGLLTKRDLAVFLGVTPRTIETYQKQGLPHFRIGPRRNRYDVRAVLDWLEQAYR